jgi:hypothetical protein
MLSECAVDNDPERQLLHACAELKRRLRSGDDCRAEHFLDAFPSLASSVDHALELIYAEFVTRQEMGQQPDPSEWLARFPQWGEELRRRFQILQVVYDNKPPDPVTVAKADATSGPALADRDTRPKPFGRYEILGRLGKGGMGVVFKASDTVLGRTVALKVMRAGILAGPEHIQRFYNEARAAAKIEHPNVIKLYEIGQEEDQHYFTMAFAPGGSLADHRESFANDPKAAAALVEKIARAVHCLHSKGILHRDLKPPNVLFDEKGEPLVSEFGLAKFTDDDAGITHTGDVVGTPAYMSPEQAAGYKGAITPQSDVWALGVILYELLTGLRPFTGMGMKEVSRQILTTFPAHPRTFCPQVDRCLENIVLKCLAKEASRRYASAEDLADDLARWARGEPILARPIGRCERARRWFGRHPAVGAMVVLAPLLLILTTAAYLVVRYLSDPERVRERVRRELAAGRPVTFVDDDGPPIIYSWDEGAAFAKASTEFDRPFFVSTHPTALIQLWSDPPPAFRLRADMRHENNSGDGRIGLYLGYRPQGPSIPLACCYVVSFTECGWNSTALRGPDGQEGSRVKIHFHYFRPRPNLGPIEADQDINGGLFYVPTPPGKPRPWRTIEIKVTPREFAIYWKNDSGKMELAARIKMGEFLTQAKLLPWTDATMKGYSFIPSFPGTLGLYVRDSAASFKNVILEPCSSNP